MADGPRKKLPTTEEVAHAWAKARESDLYWRIQSELERVKDNQRMLVLIAHGFVELIINALVDTYCKNGKAITDDNRGYPQSVKLVILHEMGIVSDHSFRLLNWFRKLRNDAAHQPLFTLTPERLDQFVKPSHRDPAKFYDLCDDILMVLGLAYQRVVISTFSPSLAALGIGGLPPDPNHYVYAFMVEMKGNLSSEYRLPEVTT